MYRIIFYHPDNGYGILDSENECEMVATKLLFDKMLLTVICIVDYRKQNIFNKSTDYSFHRDYIDNLIFDTRYVNNF